MIYFQVPMYSTVRCCSGQPWMKQCPEIYILVEVGYLNVYCVASKWVDTVVCILLCMVITAREWWTPSTV